MTETPLDQAHAAMDSAPDDDKKRLRFFERFADSELFLLLKEEPTGDQVAPEIFDTDDGHFALIFDREERLTAFTEKPAPYAALSGRAIVTMSAGQKIGIGLNLGVAPSSFLLKSDAVDWLKETLAENPDEVVARLHELHPPGNLPERLLESLDAKLAQAAGLASTAYLARATYQGGRHGHMLALVDPLPGAEPALARAIQEALTFSGLDAGEIDVAFIRATDPVAAKLAKVGLRFDLPEPLAAETPAPPGSNPDRPPRLR
ncbi:MAG: SseB family protein [Boseongicola sp.]